MPFVYSKSIDDLKELYKSMCSLGVQIGTFKHKYNNIDSNVIFDTRKWNLIFIKQGSAETLTLKVQKGFKFTIDGDTEYRNFIAYFGVSGTKGSFRIANFIRHFSSQVPTQYKITDTARKIIVNYDRLDSTSDGIYPIGVKNWEEIHAQNPSLPKDKFHRSKENLLKTKELYPELYERIKDKDLTIIYGQNQGAETARIKRGDF